MTTHTVPIHDHRFGEVREFTTSGLPRLGRKCDVCGLYRVEESAAVSALVTRAHQWLEDLDAEDVRDIPGEMHAFYADLTAALAAERRATVERLRKRIPEGPANAAIPNWRPVEWLQRILDEEAAR